MLRMTSATQYMLCSLKKLFPIVIYSCLLSIKITYSKDLQDILLNEYINFHDSPLRFILDI